MALCVNATGTFLLFGLVESSHYSRRKQGTRFTCSHNFPRSFLMSVPMWTLIETFTLWCFANGYANWVNPQDRWLWLAVLIFPAPAIHEVHFHYGYWLIHQGPLYKWIHSIHHNSINPAPVVVVVDAPAGIRPFLRRSDVAPFAAVSPNSWR